MTESVWFLQMPKEEYFVRMQKEMDLDESEGSKTKAT